LETLLEVLKELDKELFLVINNFNSPFVDSIMFYVTDTEFWFPFYAVLLGFLVWKFKWSSLPIIGGLAIVILFSDQLTSGFMKPFFERLRPCHEPGIKDIVHLVDGCGKLYGFASGHASNSFGIATFLWLVTRKWWKYSVWLMAWAAIVSYSRIYAGEHYPGDILVGALIGILFALIIFVVYQKALVKFNLPRPIHLPD